MTSGRRPSVSASCKSAQSSSCDVGLCVILLCVVCVSFMCFVCSETVSLSFNYTLFRAILLDARGDSCLCKVDIIQKGVLVIQV